MVKMDVAVMMLSDKEIYVPFLQTFMYAAQKAGDKIL
jgi:hypothetical protein